MATRKKVSASEPVEKKTAPAKKTIVKKTTAKTSTTVSKPKTKSVVLELAAPYARMVYLAGEFNDWSDQSHPLKQDAKTGLWKITIKLQPGLYHYKFVVDGEWWSDPSNPNWEWNQYGSHNSFLKVE